MNDECEKFDEHVVDCACDTKPFEPISNEIQKISSETGLDIYLELRNKYPEDTVKDLDIILNSLCAALLCLIKNRVEASNQMPMVELIHEILSYNVR